MLPTAARRAAKQPLLAGLLGEKDPFNNSLFMLASGLVYKHSPKQSSHTNPDPILRALVMRALHVLTLLRNLQ